MKRVLFAALTIMALAFTSLSAFAAPAPQKKSKKSRLESRPRAEGEAADRDYLVKEIRKELVTLPFFGVFAWLEG
jgi:hypothetical protein